MASAPQTDLPLLYKDLAPISMQLHADMRLRLVATDFLKTVHAVPLLSEEFILAQRHYPIVFSMGDQPVPLALMGLNEGVNVFVDEQGMFPADVYVPAYIRRYPFLLARLRPDADELSLCFDPTSGVLTEDADGEPAFVGGEPSERVREILGFTEKFEESSLMTGAFVRELVDHKLMMEGEFKVEGEGMAQPFLYRGFQILSEDAIRNLRGDVARKLIQNGALPLIYAHFFSMGRMSELFNKQMALGARPAAMAVN